MAILKECMECKDTFYGEHELCPHCRAAQKRRETNEYDNGEDNDN